MFSFLDINISRYNGLFTSVFCKSTFTGLYTNVDIRFSYVAFKSLLQHLLFISYLSFWTWKFYENVYSYFLNKCISCFLDNIFCPEPKVSLVSKKIIYFSFPFTEQHSLQLRNQIRKLCSSAFLHISIRFLLSPVTLLITFFPV